MLLELTNTALPYDVEGNPIPQDDKLYYTYGRNVLTSAKRFAQRRPGFPSALETTATTFSGVIKRQFQWQRWSGAYIWIVNEVTGTQSKVWKLAFGTDSSFQLIHTDTTSTNPFYFIVDANMMYFGNGVDMKKYNGTTVTNWGMDAPTVTPTLAAGAGTLTGDYRYIYCYHNSVTGHLSSPSVVSAPITLAGQGAAVSVTASADTQVTGIKIFRTTAGGDGIFSEITGSPFANATGVAVTDTTADTSLNTGSAVTTSSASRNRINDRPPAANGFVYYAGRIWMFVDNKVWYTKFEEDASGVLAESVPGGTGGNYFPYDNQVTAIEAVEDGVLVFTAKAVHKIEGDSQNTFRRYTVAQGRGARSQACVARNGRAVAWLDTGNQIWATDGLKLEEIGKPIRDDISAINQSRATMCFVEKNIYRWLVLNDRGAELLRIFDLDLEQWLVPWTVTADSVFAGEVAAGQTEFCVANTKVLKMVPTTFNDNGSNYNSSLGTSLIAISDKGAALKDIIAEFSGTEPTMKRQFDDDPFDPTLIPYSTVPSAAMDFISSGTYLTTKKFPESGTLGTSGKSARGRRMSLLMEWPSDGTDFQLYSIRAEVANV